MTVPNSIDNGPALTAPINRATPAGVLIVGGADFLELEQALRQHGYHVRTAKTAIAAIRELKRSNVAVVVCNRALPDSDGLDLIPRVHAVRPDVSLVMFSRSAHARDVRDALLTGASDYLLEPFTLSEVASTVEQAIQGRSFDAVPARAEPIRGGETRGRPVHPDEPRRLEFISTGIAETLINAMEAKNPYLRGHSQRVAELAASIAEALSLSAEGVEQIRLAGRLHDVGKIGIRESVLDKPGRLEPHEYAHVKDHVRIGLQILAPLTHLGVVLDFISEHHERLDGSGYPKGLCGDAISLGGRIIATADVFDALTSQRAYRDSRSEQDTLTYMEALVGTSLFREPFDALRRVVEQRQSLVFLGDLRVPGEHIVGPLEVTPTGPNTEPNGHVSKHAVGKARPEALARAIRRLPQFERTILALAYLEELTDLQIARVFNVDVGVVSARKSAALQRLSPVTAE